PPPRRTSTRRSAVQGYRPRSPSPPPGHSVRLRTPIIRAPQTADCDVRHRPRTGRSTKVELKARLAHRRPCPIPEARAHRSRPRGSAPVTVPPTGTPVMSNELSMRERLLEVLAPSAGERILEVGCGTGYYALHVARDLVPAGSLEIVDTQPQVLDEAIRGAREQRLVNVAATLGDARYLPYDTDEFDAAYLVAALGDAQDPDTAMGELARVVRPRGRVVVGELPADTPRV